MPKKITEFEAKKWLENNAPHIEIIKWGGAARVLSVFYEKIRQISFEYKFKDLKSQIKERPNVSFGCSIKERIEKARKTNLVKYGVEIPIRLKTFQEKRKKTNLTRYGTENLFQSKEIKEKIRQTCLKKYGPEGPQQNKEIKEKIRQTCLQKHGTEFIFTSKNFLEKRKQSCLKKYNTEHPSKLEIVKDKMKQTNLARYGVEHVSQNKNILNKAIKKSKATKRKKGLIKVIDGMSLYEWADKEDIASYSQLLLKHKEGFHPTELRPRHSILEIKVKRFLKEKNINFIANNKLPEHKGMKKGYKRPDFLLPKYDLIIECDGKYWHQNKQKDQERNKIYKSFGYKLLCFTDEDIEKKWSHVEKKILNKISKIHN